MAKKSEQLPAEDTIEEVAPDVLRLQLPANFTGLGHVNMYTLVDERGIAVVDPGLPGKEYWNWIPRRLQAAGFSVSDIHTVVITHSHPDHFGGAGRLAEEADADIVTHAVFRLPWEDEPDLAVLASPDNPDAEEEPGHHGHPATDRSAARTTSWRRPRWNRPTPWGTKNVKPPMRQRLRITSLRWFQRRYFLLPVPTRRMLEGEVIRLARRDWFAVHTPGHTPDHLCLWDPAERVMISGDHVLPSITPHINGMGAGQDPLDEFVKSLDRVAAYDAQVVLPAHGVPFHDLTGRVEAIKSHHVKRLEQVAEISKALGPASVEEFSHELFPRRHWGMMAESETFAHLEHMVLEGDAERWTEHGTYVYRIAS